MGRSRRRSPIPTVLRYRKTAPQTLSRGVNSENGTLNCSCQKNKNSQDTHDKFTFPQSAGVSVRQISPTLENKGFQANLGENFSPLFSTFQSASGENGQKADWNGASFPARNHTVKYLALAYLDMAQREHSKRQYNLFRYIVKHWVEPSGFWDLPVDSFTPQHMLAIREQIRASGRVCLDKINDFVNRIRSIFKWGWTVGIVSSSDLILRLRELKPLSIRAKGVFVHESRKEKARKLTQSAIDRTLQHAHIIVKTMAEWQQYYGFRNEEVTEMRVGEVDISDARGNGLWYYTPGSHKMQHKTGEVPSFPIGKKWQKILAPFLAGKNAEHAVFSHRQVHEDKMAKSRAERKSKITPSQKKRDKERAKNPKNKIGEFFTAITYRNAIKEAIAEANKHLAEGEAPIPHWFPRILRNKCATDTEGRHGMATARAKLGHLSDGMTRQYSSGDLQILEKLALEEDCSESVDCTDSAGTP